MPAGIAATVFAYLVNISADEFLYEQATRARVKQWIVFAVWDLSFDNPNFEIKFSDIIRFIELNSQCLMTSTVIGSVESPM